MKTSKGNLELKYSVNAIAAHEEGFGIPFFEDLGEMAMSSLRRLICSGLYYCKAALTLAQAGDIIEDAICCGMDLIDIKNEIIKALENAPFLMKLAGRGVDNGH